MCSSPPIGKQIINEVPMKKVGLSQKGPGGSNNVEGGLTQTAQPPYPFHQPHNPAAWGAHSAKERAAKRRRAYIATLPMKKNIKELNEQSISKRNEALMLNQNIDNQNIVSAGDKGSEDNSTSVKEITHISSKDKMKKDCNEDSSASDDEENKNISKKIHCNTLSAQNSEDFTEKNEDSFSSESDQTPNQRDFVHTDEDVSSLDSYQTANQQDYYDTEQDVHSSESDEIVNQQGENKKPMPSPQVDIDLVISDIDTNLDKDHGKIEADAINLPATVGAQIKTAISPTLASTSVGALVSPKLPIVVADVALDVDQALAIKELNIYQQMIELEEQELILNFETFTCGVCLMECGVGEGAVLRECLHTYCRVCLAEITRLSNDEVVCPYRDDTYSCSAALQEREVRALVSTADYEVRLAKTFRLAGTRMKDAFHCRTPNCVGWCVHDNETQVFRCPLCNRNNCLVCTAIHEGKTCGEYLDEQQQWQDLAAADVPECAEMRNTMNCPTCKVVVMKVDGCDWVMCTVCQTEICWVRRMARWGPGGKGDYSGGCQCRRVAGMICDPKCRNCH